MQGQKGPSKKVLHLCSLRDVLHPLHLLLLIGGRQKDGLLPVVEVKTELCSEPRFAVKDGEVTQRHLSVDSEVKLR